MTQWTLERLQQVFISGSESERFSALEAMNEIKQTGDPSSIISNLLPFFHTSLKDEYTADREIQDDDQQVGVVRTWLAALLGQFAPKDHAGGAFIRELLYKEHNEWVRYWGLVGLKRGNAEDLIQIAEQIVTNQQNLATTASLKNERSGHFVMLAVVILAATKKSKEHLAVVENALNGDERAKYSVLRSLRHVPIDNRRVVKELVDIVRAKHYDEVTFEAIVALGYIPPNSPRAVDAAQGLEEFMRNTPIFAKWDTMRTRALIALGNLQVKSTVPTLLEWITYDNPGIAKEASRALIKLVDISEATSQIITAASKAGEESIKVYGTALRWMENDGLIDELVSLISSGTPRQREFAEKLLTEMGGARAFERLRAQREAVARYMEFLKTAEDSVRSQFDRAQVGARQGFNIAMIMDGVVFIIGIGLIIFSAGIVLWREGSLQNWMIPVASLGGGIGIIIYNTFIANPRQKVKDNVDHLARHNAVFLCLLRQLNQVDQAYTRRMLDERAIDPAEVEAFKKIVESVMNNSLLQLTQFSKTPTTLVERSSEAHNVSAPDIASGSVTR
jgi:HEAT repeat protein